MTVLKDLDQYHISVVGEGADYLGEQRWVGRCKEFPHLKTKKYKRKLNAIDAICALVSKEVKRLDLENQGHRHG